MEHAAHEMQIDINWGLGLIYFVYIGEKFLTYRWVFGMAPDPDFTTPDLASYLDSLH